MLNMSVKRCDTIPMCILLLLSSLLVLYCPRQKSWGLGWEDIRFEEALPPSITVIARGFYFILIIIIIIILYFLIFVFVI